MTETHHRACHLCEAICGLEIKVDDGKIISIRGDKNDPLSRGHICPKAVALQDLHEDPNRLRKPVKRVTKDDGSSDWQEISWEEALDTTAEKLAEIYQRDGKNARDEFLVLAFHETPRFRCLENVCVRIYYCHLFINLPLSRCRLTE